MRWNYIVIPGIVFGIAYLGSLFTQSGIDNGWYSGIIKPGWIPSGSVIGIAWTVIYSLITVSLLTVWNGLPHNDQVKRLLRSFIINGILNLSWSYVFFVQNQLGIALAIAIFMWFSTVEIIYNSWPLKKLAAVLLIPYAAWLILASVMNYVIWRAN